MLPCRFRKAGIVWCGGARETREPQVTIGRTFSKSETAKNLPAFQDLSGNILWIQFPKVKNSLNTYGKLLIWLKL